MKDACYRVKQVKTDHFGSYTRMIWQGTSLEDREWKRDIGRAISLTMMYAIWPEDLGVRVKKQVATMEARHDSMI